MLNGGLDLDQGEKNHTWIQTSIDSHIPALAPIQICWELRVLNIRVLTWCEADNVDTGEQTVSSLEGKSHRATCYTSEKVASREKIVL